MSKVTRSRLQVLGAALLFSTGGAAIKATDFNNWQVAAFRSAIAAAAILLFLPAARRLGDWRIWVVAVAYALTLIAFVTANKLTTAANAIFLQDTAPLYLLLASPWLLKERVTRRDLLVLAVMAVGMVLFFVGEQRASATAPDPMKGNLVAVLSAVTWAITIGGLRWLESRHTGGEPGMATVALGNTIALVLCLPLALPVAGAAAMDWAAVIYLGLIQVGLAYVLLTRGVRHVPAFEVSLLILVEPALNPVWAGLMHDEWPNLLAALGGALILGGSAWQLLVRRSG
ncbi:MAG: DMT family transporter [Bryobacterales bacterium]|nr:DMT family transporter [Bryobacterales bacterium]